MLSLLRYLLQRIAPQSRWGSRLVELFDEYRDVSLSEMGFISDWKTCPIWSGVST